MKRIAESTVRRLSLYLRLLEDIAGQGHETVSSEELARRGGTTSAQVRKDLSLFGSFGKRGLGYSVPELSSQLRDILGLGREWNVIIVGAGKIGLALAQYRGFRQRGYVVRGVYDADPGRIGSAWDDLTVRDVAALERDLAAHPADIAVIATPASAAQGVCDRLVAGGIRAILNFAPVQLQAPPEVTVRAVNMALELEGLSFALTSSRDSSP